MWERWPEKKTGKGVAYTCTYLCIRIRVGCLIGSSSSRMRVPYATRPLWGPPRPPLGTFPSRRHRGSSSPEKFAFNGTEPWKFNVQFFHGGKEGYTVTAQYDGSRISRICANIRWILNSSDWKKASCANSWVTYRCYSFVL